MRHLLQAPGFEARLDLERVQEAISRAFPLKAAHRKALPYSVQELSRLLTSERGQIQGYWQKPSLTGAYLYYFLPWNLLRLSWLLPNLPLSLPEAPKILDLGSGPLTLPLGLWMFRPELRGREVSLTCSDTAQRPMELGRAVLENLQALSADTSNPEKAEGQSAVPSTAKSPWSVRLLRAPLDVALRKAGKVNLIMAGNVLNEIQARQDSLEERLEEIFLSMDKILEPGGQILLIEPGTRLGGKLISLLRRVALAEGYQVEAPCTHDAACPYAPPELDEAAPGRGAARQASGWCHFNLTADGAPEGLTALSRAAHLEKERLSFSLIFLRKAPESAAQGKNGQRDKTVPGALLTQTRVVSDAIRLPDGDSARYVCTRHGLGLMRGAEGLKSGMLAEAALPDKAAKDFKSGAWLMQAARQPAPRGKEIPSGKPDRGARAKPEASRKARTEETNDSFSGRDEKRTGAKASAKAAKKPKNSGQAKNAKAADRQIGTTTEGKRKAKPGKNLAASDARKTSNRGQREQSGLGKQGEVNKTSRSKNGKAQSGLAKAGKRHDQPKVPSSGPSNAAGASQKTSASKSGQKSQAGKSRSKPSAKAAPAKSASSGDKQRKPSKPGKG